MSREKLVALTAMSLVVVVLMAMATAFLVGRGLDFYHSIVFVAEGGATVAEDPVIGYVGAASSSMRRINYPPFDIYTDDRGGRVVRSGETAPGKVWALFIGCSFTWGHGVAAEQTFPQIISAQAGQPVFNAAMPSYGTVAATLSIDRFIDMQPQYIVYGFIKEHAWRNFSPCADGGGFLCRPMAYLDSDDDGKLGFKPPIADGSAYAAYARDVMLRHDFGWRDIYWAIYRDIYTAVSDRFYRRTDFNNFWPVRGNGERYLTHANNSDWRERGMRYAVDDMVSRTRQIGAKLVFVNIPSRLPITSMPPEMRRAIQGFVDSGDMIFVDMTQAFMALEDKVGPFSALIYDDGHPTAEGHRQIALAVQEAIVADSQPPVRR